MGVYKNNSGTLDLLAGGTLYADNPIGSIVPFGGDSAPSGWLLCQGQAISRTTYSDLFAVIGTTFGSGNGTTTFNIPDLRGKVPVGLNSSDAEFNALGKTGGEKTHTLTKDEMPSHTHTQKPHSHSTMYSGGSGAGWPIVFNATQNTCSTWGPSTTSITAVNNNTGGDGAHNNLQPYNTVNYIIKATIIALPSDFESAVNAKISALDVASVGGSGKYISAISESDGKISATATNLSTTPTRGSAVPITSGGVYAKFASFDTWTDVTSAAVNLTNVVAASTSIKVYSNGRQCKIVGEYFPTSAQAINDGWISSLTNISIKAGYRPKYETALAGFFAANHHSPIVWYVIPSGAITGYLGTVNSVTTSITRIPINGMWYIA